MMHFKIARGFARSYMQSMRTRQDFEKQMDGNYHNRIIGAFCRSASSKKPGRTLERISKTLDRDWMDLHIMSWTRNMRAVTARIITYDAEARIELQGDYDRIVFNDDLIQFNELIVSADRFAFDSRRGALVSMTLHAITRLLERNGCVPEDLSKVIPELLRVSRHVVVNGFSRSYPEATKSFLIPFGGGAFVAINCPVKPSQGQMQALTDGLSIRTWLSPDMITSEMDARLEAMDAFLEATYHGDQFWAKEQAQEPLERNARPYDYREKSRTQLPQFALAAPMTDKKEPWLREASPARRADYAVPA